MDHRDESLHQWSDKSELERTLLVGVHGAPELKPDEKQKYLGAFREQVLVWLSDKQVKDPAVYPEIVQALKQPQAKTLIINGTLNSTFVKKYQTLALKLRKAYRIVSDAAYERSTGIVVVSDKAVHVDKAEVENRATRLRKLGVNEALIRAAGRKVCRECLNEVLSADPQEKINYKKLRFIDRITGGTCPAHD